MDSDFEDMQLVKSAMKRIKVAWIVLVGLFIIILHSTYSCALSMAFCRNLREIPFLPGFLSLPSTTWVRAKKKIASLFLISFLLDISKPHPPQWHPRKTVCWTTSYVMPRYNTMYTRNLSIYYATQYTKWESRVGHDTSKSLFKCESKPHTQRNYGATNTCFVSGLM